jgi:hypothetical protein
LETIPRPRILVRGAKINATNQNERQSPYHSLSVVDNLFLGFTLRHIKKDGGKSPPSLFSQHCTPGRLFVCHTHEARTA